MWFRLSYGSNAELVKSLPGLRTKRVIDAMLATDRKHYTDCFPYDDSPQPIGYGVTISAPHMHAAALEHLASQLVEGSSALDVGSGSGYLAGCMARLVGVLEGKGTVIGMEVITPLVELGRRNVEKDDPRLSQSGRLRFALGNGWDGIPEEGPFNAIHVGAAADSIPDKLVEQLAPGGKLFVPIGPPGECQHVHLITKSENGRISDQQLYSVAYVPLVHTAPRI